ncbi:hypothetical protein [Paraburkholderia sp.]|uniref:hypothetical protein n=1 Tax=Paraburkholderia sp. TaxID=1926495 RepID=UPI0039E3E311
MHDKVGPLFDRLSMHFYASKCMGIAAAPQSAATVALTDQRIYDKFGFLEGLVSENTYRKIAKTAIEIYKSAASGDQP